MATRRAFIGQTTAVLLAACNPAARAGSSEDAATLVGGSRTAGKPGARIKAVIRREETTLRYGGHGDNWHMSWASDDRQYVSLCDGGGFANRPKVNYNSRMLTLSGGPTSAVFSDLAGYPILGAPGQQTNDPRYYGFGTLALDGKLYQFMSTFNRPVQSDDIANPKLDDYLRFNGAKLIYATNNGRAWHNQDGSTPVIWEGWNRRSRETLVFFDEDQEAFSLLSVLQMGKNYEHNRDGYVYVYAPNGNIEGTMNELVMFRAPKKRLLERASYEFFAGHGGSAKWTKDIRDRRVVHTFPCGWVNKLVHPFAWQPSVVFNAPLGIYMMANWGMGTGSNGMWFDKPSYLGLWIANEPWGPWTQIHEETRWQPSGDCKARAYEPQIVPKWIAPDGKSFWLVWTDFQGGDDEKLKKFWQQYQRKAESNGISEADVAESVEVGRQSMPYYAFNVQRVDLVMG